MGLPEVEGLADGVDVVELFPCEEFDLEGLGAAVVVGVEGLGDGAWLASHVAVGCGFLVDGVAELEALLDGVGTEVEEPGDVFGYLAVAVGDVAGAVGLDVDADGLGYADGVGELDEDLVGNAGGDEVLGDVTGGVGCAAVYLGGVLAGEGAAAMGALAAVGVDDYLAACEAGVAQSPIPN